MKAPSKKDGGEGADQILARRELYIEALLAEIGELQDRVKLLTTVNESYLARIEALKDELSWTAREPGPR